LAVALAGQGSARSGDAEKRLPAAGQRTEDMSWGPVEMRVTFDPARVDLRRDVMVTITISAPPEIEVAMPDLSSRLEGFVVSGAFDEEPVTRGGKIRQVRRCRLTPILSRRYRLAPMAVAYQDRGGHSVSSGWFLTKPVILEEEPLIAEQAGSQVAGEIKPVWIYPSFRSVLVGLALAAALVAVGAVVWKWSVRIREERRVRRLSPRERALRELAELLGKDLVGKGLIKDFYVEITMIVRRYIERQHGIRAPEQTTEEFLAAVANDPRFSSDVIRKLKAFLEAADLVKFAAYQPEKDAPSKAVATAREYIETDAGAGPGRDGCVVAAPPVGAGEKR